jgi:hypothetical protein
VGQEGNTSFLKKRSKRLSLRWLREAFQLHQAKSFLVLFFKKERLALPVPL